MKARLGISTACAIVIASCMAPERQQTAFEGDTGGTGGIAGSGGTGGTQDASAGTSPGGDGGSAGTGGDAGSAGAAGEAGAAGTGGTAGSAGIAVIECKWAADSKLAFDHSDKAEGPVSVSIDYNDESTYLFGNVGRGGIRFGTQHEAVAELAAYVVKFGKTGAHEWTRLVDGKGLIHATGSSWSIGTAVFVGQVDPTMKDLPELDLTAFGGPKLMYLGDHASSWVLRLNTSYDGMVWHHELGSAEGAVRVWGTAMDTKGDVIIAGSGPASLEFGCGASDAGVGEDGFVAKYEGLTGDCKWVRRFAAYPLAVATGLDDEPVVVGNLSESFTVLGTTVERKGGLSDAFVLKLGRDGDQVSWAKSYGSLQDDAARSVAVDMDGNAWVAVRYADDLDLDVGGPHVDLVGSTSYLLLKLDRLTGTLAGHKLFGNLEIPSAHGVAAIGVGLTSEIAVTGTLEGSWDFGSGELTPVGGDVFVARYDKDLNLRYARSWGDASSQGGRSVGVFENGDVVLTGTYEGELTFGAPCKPLSHISGEELSFITRIGAQ